MRVRSRRIFLLALLILFYLLVGFEFAALVVAYKWEWKFALVLATGVICYVSYDWISMKAGRTVLTLPARTQYTSSHHND